MAKTQWQASRVFPEGTAQVIKERRVHEGTKTEYSKGTQYTKKASTKTSAKIRSRCTDTEPAWYIPISPTQ